MHKMSKPVFWDKIRKYSTVSSAEIITQHAKRLTDSDCLRINDANVRS